MIFSRSGGGGGPDPLSPPLDPHLSSLMKRVICKLVKSYIKSTLLGQYMNRSTFCEIKFMKGLFFFLGQVYDWGWFQNTGSLTRTKITPELPPRDQDRLLCMPDNVDIFA